MNVHTRIEPLKLLISHTSTSNAVDTCLMDREENRIE